LQLRSAKHQRLVGARYQVLRYLAGTGLFNLC
jgi:hypothetical protein